MIQQPFSDTSYRNETHMKRFYNVILKIIKKSILLTANVNKVCSDVFCYKCFQNIKQNCFPHVHSFPETNCGHFLH